MNKSPFKLRSNGLRRVGMRLIQAAALALVVAMAIPARAADIRAVKVRVAPAYPEIAKRMRITGEVRLEVTVDPAGNVTGVVKLSGNGMLSAAAEEAVRKWKFDSGPDTSTVEVALNFALGQ